MKSRNVFNRDKQYVIKIEQHKKIRLLIYFSSDYPQEVKSIFNDESEIT